MDSGFHLFISPLNELLLKLTYFMHIIAKTENLQILEKVTGASLKLYSFFWEEFHSKGSSPNMVDEPNDRISPKVTRHNI